MKKLATALVSILATGLTQADDLQGVNEMVCAVSQVHICIEDDTCYTSATWELGVPDFIVINVKKETISTTRASGLNRSTPFSSVSREAGMIYLQGMEGARAFSFVIDEASGRLTVAVSRDGLAVSIFGACTDTDL